MSRAVVAGAGGFIGHHLVKHLKSSGHWVRGVDVKRPEFEETEADEFFLADLRDLDSALAATSGVDEVYQLAADMGGIGYITAVRADVARNNVLINAHMLEASRRSGVERFFFSSSACVYPVSRQSDADARPLREQYAHPADPEPGYGWEKLFSEQLCRYYDEEGLLPTRVARFHNIYGPLGTFEGGREKAPAAICRKVALADDGAAIEVWGDGRQTRSYCYVADCVEGIHRIMRSDRSEPLNLGSEDLISVDGLVDLVCRIARKKLTVRHEMSAPQGVRGRNSDNALLRTVLGWEPATPLEDGLRTTYEWIESRVRPETAVRLAS